MIALVHNPDKRARDAIGFNLLIAFALFVSASSTALGQDSVVAEMDYVKPLQDQQQELGRIDDALKSGIQQIERACKPFIEDESLDAAALTPDTFLQIDQAKTNLEKESDNVLLQFKNVRNIANLKTSELCNSTINAQPTASCRNLNALTAKLDKFEAYFLRTKSKNIQIFDYFMVVGKLEALNCVSPDFTFELIQSYLRSVNENDISGLKYYQTKLNQLKSEIQAHD